MRLQIKSLFTDHKKEDNARQKHIGIQVDLDTKWGIQVDWYKIKRCMQEPYKNWNLSLKVIIFFMEDVNKPISQVLIKLITMLLGMLMNKSKGKIPRPTLWSSLSSRENSLVNWSFCFKRSGYRWTTR